VIYFDLKKYSVEPTNRSVFFVCAAFKLDSLNDAIPAQSILMDLVSSGIVPQLQGKLHTMADKSSDYARLFQSPGIRFLEEMKIVWRHEAWTNSGIGYRTHEYLAATVESQDFVFLSRFRDW